MALAKASKTSMGSSSKIEFLHEVRPCPECGGADRRESRPGNIVLTCYGCGYRAEFEAAVLRDIASSEEH